MEVDGHSLTRLGATSADEGFDLMLDVSGEEEIRVVVDEVIKNGNYYWKSFVVIKWFVVGRLWKWFDEFVYFWI